MSKLCISILFFSFLTSNSEVWGGKKLPKDNKKSSKNIPENLEESAGAELRRLEALEVPRQHARGAIREILSINFSKDTENLLEEYPAVWEMMTRSKYYEAVNTEKFDELKKLFPLFPATDQRTVRECIWNNIVNNKGTDEAKILQAFIDKYDNDQKKSFA